MNVDDGAAVGAVSAYARVCVSECACVVSAVLLVVVVSAVCGAPLLWMSLLTAPLGYCGRVRTMEVRTLRTTPTIQSAAARLVCGAARLAVSEKAK